MTSEVIIDRPKRKVPELYARDNIIGVLSIHLLNGKKMLKQQRFYSTSARQMLMDDWRKEFAKEIERDEVFFKIRLDKIPNN